MFPQLGEVMKLNRSLMMESQIPTLTSLFSARTPSSWFTPRRCDPHEMLRKRMHEISTERRDGDKTSPPKKRQKIDSSFSSLLSFSSSSLSSSSSSSSSSLLQDFSPLSLATPSLGPISSLEPLLSSSSFSSLYPPTSSSGLPVASLQSLQDDFPRIKCKLLPHQEENVKWLLEKDVEPYDKRFFTFLETEEHDPFRYNPYTGQLKTGPEPMSQPSGGFLIDGTGLGKTISTLAFIIETIRKGTKGSSLVIVPTTIFSQWKGEIEKHTSGLVVKYFYGKDKKSLTVEDLSEADLVLTTYSSLVKAQPTPEYQNFLEGQKR